MSSYLVVQRTEMLDFQVKITVIEVLKPTEKKRPLADVQLIYSFYL